MVSPPKNQLLRLLNDNLAAKADKLFDLTGAYDNGDLSNALTISTTEVNSSLDKSGRLRSSGATNKPSDCSFGVRHVFSFDATHKFVVIYGFDTSVTVGIWINAYNAGSWTGWKRVSLT